MFEVIGYENRCIFVKSHTTGEIHTFEVDDDGTLRRSDAQTDQVEARQAAILYLSVLGRARRLA
jgi:hypothetical protein